MADKRRAWITVTPDTFVEAIWYVEGGDKNWLACAMRDGAGPWRIIYRFRYYNDDQAWGSTDDREGVTAEGKDGTEISREQMVEACDFLANEIEAAWRGKRWKLVVRGGPDAFSAAMTRMPWVDARTGSPDA